MIIVNVLTVVIEKCLWRYSGFSERELFCGESENENMFLGRKLLLAQVRLIIVV